MAVWASGLARRRPHGAASRNERLRYTHRNNRDYRRSRGRAFPTCLREPCDNVAHQERIGNLHKKRSRSNQRNHCNTREYAVRNSISSAPAFSRSSPLLERFRKLIQNVEGQVNNRMEPTRLSVCAIMSLKALGSLGNVGISQPDAPDGLRR